MSERICASCGESFPSIWATLPHLFLLPWRCPAIRDSCRHAYDLRAALGWRYVFRVLYLEMSVPLGYTVRCFGEGCRTRVEWDPIVGAYCDDHWPTRLPFAEWSQEIDPNSIHVVRDAENLNG